MQISGIYSLGNRAGDSNKIIPISSTAPIESCIFYILAKIV